MQTPDFVVVTDGGFRVERVQVYRPVPLLRPPHEQLGIKLQDIMDPRVMHILGNAAQAAVLAPDGIDTEYPIKIHGQWYRSRNQIVAVPGEHRLIMRVRRLHLLPGKT